MARSSASGRPRTRTSTRRGGSTGSSTACSRPTGSRSRRSPTSWIGWRRRTACTSRRPRTARWGSGRSPWPLSEGSSVPSTTSSGSAAVPTTPTSCGAVSGATSSGSIPRWRTPTGRCSACRAPSARPWRGRLTINTSQTRRSRSGGARPTTPTGTACSAAATCRTSADVRRGSLLEGWFDAGTSPLDPVSPWAQAALTLATEALASTVSTASGGVAVTLTREAGASVRVEKTVTIRDATVEVRYRLGTPAGMTGVSGRWAVQFNVALTAGDAPGRYLTATGRPSLGSTGRERGAAGVTLVDEWVGVRARLERGPVAELAWGPVQTVSVSEAGFERIYQGTALLIVWPVELRTGEPRELSASITLERS